MSETTLKCPTSLYSLYLQTEPDQAATIGSTTDTLFARRRTTTKGEPEIGVIQFFKDGFCFCLHDANVGIYLCVAVCGVCLIQCC